MTRYRIRAPYAILDNLPPDPDAVVLSTDDEVAALGDRLARGEEPRPFSIEINGEPILTLPTLQPIYSNRVRVTTGGRPPGRGLDKRASDLQAFRTALGATLSQERLAGLLGVEPVTVKRYFSGGYWEPFCKTGALPPRSR